MPWRRQLTGAQRDAAGALVSMFESYGLGALAPRIIGFVQQGYGTEVITTMLQETKEYKQRFAANEARRKAGLAVLNPAEYLATERAYKQALQAAGMPEGFYDNPVTDFRKFLEQDISPTEIADRANAARALADTVDPLQRSFLWRNHSIGLHNMAAYFLDPTRALPLLQKEVDLVRLGVERERAGYSYDQRTAERLYQSGIDWQAARQGYGVIQQLEPTMRKLGEISGQDFGVEDLEAEVFEQSGEAATRRRRLASQERGRFSGSAGTSRGTLTRTAADY